MAKVNEDLVRERNGASFHVAKVTHLLDGGSGQTARRRQLEAIVARDPSGVFDNSSNIYLHRTERHVRSLAKAVRLFELARTAGLGEEAGAEGELMLSPDMRLLIDAVADDLPTSLHWVMFVPNIRSLCDEEQQARWLPMCRDFRMIGCYAQTEIGHGSNVRGLETTAIFRSEQDGGGPGGGFVIHSPTVTATKFWPGTLGRTANHAMVIARLIDGAGVDRGMHNFLVQLRSFDDHTLLPGVLTGDIGPKIGYNNMDNGFARFDQVLIPRRNMAMRFAHVNEQGAYSKNKSANTDATSKVAYITMMQVRAHIVNEAGKNLALACTMSIRYSAVRRQGFRNDNDKQEVQIIDYRQQQHRLFPLLAASYCFFFTGRKILAQLKALEERMLSGSGTVTKAQVADIHASSSALKSFTTTVTADGIEDCRKACGGHGFLQSSGLPELSLTYLQSPTVEGDNHMLPQQVVKVLLKIVQTVQSNNEAALAEYDMCDSKYLIEPLRSMLSQRKHENKPSCTATSRVEMRQLPVLLKALQHRSARLLLEVAQQLELSVRAGASAEQAWNDALIQMARMSRAHSLFLLLNNFVSSLETEHDRSDSDTGPHEIQVLQDLAVLFGLYWIERDMGDFLEDAYLSKEQASWVRGAVLDMLDVVRPNAVALVDARDFSDFRLKSCVGRWDGNVYEAILESSKRDPLNATEPGPGYDAHLRKLIVQGAARYTGTSSRL